MFNVSIYTPSKVLAKDLKATELIVPTTRGEIDILPNHTHIVTNMGTGILTVKTPEGTKTFSSTVGVCKVLKDDVTILLNTSEKAEDVNKERAEKAKLKAQEKLSGKTHISEDELLKYQRKLSRAEIRLKMALLNKNN